MAVWLIRAGSYGEYEQKFIEEKRVYVTWPGLDINLSSMEDWDGLKEVMKERYTDESDRTIASWAGQVWRFALDIKQGDLIVMPLKTKRAIQIGEITGEYHFEPAGPDPYFHWRSVKWIGEAIPRTSFGQDLLYSFGALQTICCIDRNDAENRLRAMQRNAWKPEQIAKPKPTDGGGTGDGEQPIDIEELAEDQIIRVISSRYTGHNLARLVEGILKAQGYTTYRSPEGPDGGVDILAGLGPLGFGSPKLCVQVKSQDTPVDRPTVQSLLGTMKRFGAEQGLFVSWGGYKGNVQRDMASSFFELRLWSQFELLDELYAHYEQLDDDLKTELPLKRIWMIATPEKE